MAHGASSTPVVVSRAIGVIVAVTLPLFLTGSMAVQIQRDLEFGPARLGLAVASYFAVASLVSVRIGRVVERHAATASLTLAAGLSSLVLLGIAGSSSWLQLTLLMSVGGVCNSIGQPSANVSIANSVDASRLGLAIGLKQSSVPAATFAAGLAVPMFVTGFGWRWSFVAGATGTACLALVGLRRGHDASVEARPPSTTADRLSGGTDRRTMLLALGAALGSGAGTCVGIFLVGAGTAQGIDQRFMGFLLATISLVGVSVRILLGALVDLRLAWTGHRLIALLLSIGAVGFALLANGEPSRFVVGAVLAFLAGWGWTGLSHYATLRTNAQTPAAATGILQRGLSAGACLGPLAFGLAVETHSYALAWWLTALFAAMAAGTVLLAGRRRWMHSSDQAMRATLE